MQRSSIFQLKMAWKSVLAICCLLCVSPSLFAQLSGSYTVGASGTYSSITAAVAAYNTGTLTGPVTFVLTDATYPAETFPLTINNNTSASAANTLTIKPGAGVAATITGGTADKAIFKLLNARYVTIDGVNSGGSTLTINNTNTGTSAAIWLASTATLGPGCRNIALMNMAINGGSNTTTADYGILAGVDGTNPSTTGGLDNDSVTIQGNTLLKCGYGIYAKGTTALSAGGMDNWTISNNIIGPSAGGTNNIGYTAIFMGSALNASITGNTIRNVGYTGSSSLASGINLTSNVNGVTISTNTINNVSSAASLSGVSSNTGILMGSAVINATVNRNKITSISNTSTGGWGVRGIIINTGNATSNITCANNMLADIWCYADVSLIYAPVGIDIEGTSGGIKLYFNSINLYGSHTGYSSGGTSAVDLYMNSSGGNIDVRDNVLVNAYDNSSSTTDKAYAIYSSYAATSFSAIDYNDYYVYAPTGVLGYLGSDRTTLPALVTGFGGNTHSINNAPLFVAPTDLHLQVAGANAPLVAGIAISGITIDIDGIIRSGTNPVIGAHEVAIPPCGPVTVGAIVAATPAFCASGSTTLTIPSATGALGITYQWLSSADSASFTPIAGATTMSYTTPTLTTTTYYRVVVRCSFSGNADSSARSVTIHPLPVIAVSPDGGSICTGNSLTMTASGAATYVWTPTTGLSTASGATVTATPTVSTTYTVTGTDVFGCVSAHASTVGVTITPTAVAVTPDSLTICAGTSQLLTAASNITGPATALSQTLNSGVGAWTIDNTGTTSTYPNVTWTVHGDGYTNELSTYHSPDNSNFILTNSDTAGSGVTVQTLFISPIFSLAGYTAASFSFQHAYRYYGSGDVNASVEISQDGGTTWSLLHDYTADATSVGSYTAFVTANYDMTPYLGMSNLKVRFNYHSVFGYYWALDNISVSGTQVLPVTNITWAPGTGLYTDAALTTPYTGGAATSIYASPSSGVTVYTATATNGACSSVGTATIPVSPLADAGTISGGSVVCIGSTITLTDPATGGVWSVANGNGSISASGVFTGISAGIDTVKYTVTNGCGASVATKIVTVNPLPNAGVILSDVSSLCVGSSAPVTDSVSGGVWSSSTGAATISASGVITGVSAGTTVISYTITNSCGVATATLPLTINPLPDGGTIAGATSLCIGSATTLTSAISGGVWSSSSSAVATVSSVGVVTGVSAGTVNISYAVSNVCGTAVATHVITVNSLPAIFTVTGGGTYCEGGMGVAVGLSSSATGVSYQLYLAGVATGAPVAGTGSALDFGLQTGAGNYTVGAVNTATTCSGNMTGSATVVINPTASPSVSISSTAGDTVCAATAVTYTAIPVNGGDAPSYAWTVNGATVSIAASYSYIPANGDVIRVLITSSSCAMPDTASSSVTMTITDVLVPSVNISSTTGSDSACAGYPVTYTATAVNGGAAPGYRWTKNGINVATGPTFTFIPVNGDVVYVKMSSSLPCAPADSVSSSTHTLHVRALVVPTVTINAHPGTTIAPGTSDTLTAIVANAGSVPTYQWRINGTAVPGATQATFISSALVTGNIVSCYVTSSGLCGGLTASASVTINAGATATTKITVTSDAIQVFPNPNSGTFTIKGNLQITGNEVAIQVTDMLGQIVYSNKVQTSSGQLNEQVSLNNTLANGMYTINVQSGEERYTAHFVIQR